MWDLGQVTVPPGPLPPIEPRACLDCGCGPQDVGRGYLAVLTIFTILEFFIAVIATHFGCQATRAQANMVSTPPPAAHPTRGL